MLNSIWAKLFIVLAVIGLIKWAHYTIDLGGYNRCEVKYEKFTNKAVEKARKEEQAKQEKVDEAAQKQFNEQLNINARLNADLDRLRERAKRKQPTKESESICKGATGADLSGEDASFLTREAARADQIRAGLKACYSYADSVTKKSPN